jgi:hypothetical protein
MTEPVRRPAGQWTPAGLGVHQVAGGGPMPSYYRRPHDERLRAVLNPETEYSRLVVVRGDALSGTSRTVYEAVTDVLADWALEYLPTAAALAARLEAGIPARTVLWLGELRDHADADGGAAIFDRLDDVLEDDGRVVAITTIWPGYWDSYTAAAAAGLGAADPAAVVGRILAQLDVLAEYDPASLDPAYGGVVDVPARFTAAEMAAAADVGDPALAAAVAAAGPDGQVTQHLAGARDLLTRYDGPGTDPYGHAIITAALDAARLGYASPLPAALLRDAAVGYLADPGHPRWDTALAGATDSGWALQLVPPAADNGAPGYRVAGYLDQYGRSTRGDQPGPASLWDALITHVGSAGDLGRLARAARDRGLYRYAATLWTAAAAVGRTDAAARLDHTGGVAELLEALHTVGAGDAFGALAARAAAAVSLEDGAYAARLLHVLRVAGADEAIQILLARDPVGQASLMFPEDAAQLLEALRAAGAGDAAQALAVRVADPAQVYHLWDTSVLAALRAAGAWDAIRTVSARVAGQVHIDHPEDVADLLEELREAGAAEAVRALAVRAAGAGMFGLFLEARPDEAAAYRFGREPDGTPSPPWSWSEPAGPVIP